MSQQDTQKEQKEAQQLPNWYKKTYKKIPFLIKLAVLVAAGYFWGFQYAVLIYFSTSFIATTIEGGGLKKVLGIYRQVRISIILKDILVLASVVGVSFVLLLIPPLQWSWFSLLHSQSTNIAVASATIYGWGLLFLAIFIVAIPILSGMEEEFFRLGTITWLPVRQVEITGGDAFERLKWRIILSGGIVRSLLFGLAHCLMGVPIGVGLALSVGGLWFTHQYFKGGKGETGVERSTVYHTTYNLIIATLLVVVGILTLFHVA